MIRNLLILIALVILFAGCTSTEYEEFGKEGNECFADRTCERHLECVNGICVPEDDDEDGDTTDGDAIDGDTTDGDTIDGDTPNCPSGFYWNPAERRCLPTADGDLTDGDTTDGDVSDGDATDGDIEDGDTTDGDILPECMDFTIDSFGFLEGKTHLAFADVAYLRAELPDGVDALSLQVEPQTMQRFFNDEGDGNGTFNFNEVDAGFKTTEVRFVLDIARGACTVHAEALIKALGNVWITDIDADSVDIFRSDGSYIQRAATSTYLNDPWSLIELADGTVGVGSRHQGGVEVYDYEGNHTMSFDTEDSTGNYLYSIYGAYAMMYHQPDGKIWVGGPRSKVLTYSTNGTYDETIYISDNYNVAEYEAQSLIQLGDSSVVAVSDKSWGWDLHLYSVDGDYIGRFGDNSDILDLQVGQIANAPGGKVVAAGHVGYPANKGYIAVLTSGGILQKYSEPLEGLYPDYGLMAFGQGFLACTDQDTVAFFDSNLNLVNDNWTGDKTGRWRALLLKGGN